MKNYFSFTMNAKKIFPYWLLIYVLLVTPYALLILNLRNIQAGVMPPAWIFLSIPAIFIAVFYMYFYFVKLFIQGVCYKEKNLEFNGTPIGFLGVLLLGMVLSLFTLGIYIAWFTRDIVRFFVNNTAYDSEYMEFQGKGSDLFIILLVTLFLPMIIFVMVGFKYLLALSTMNVGYRYLFQVVEYLVLLPYMYFAYRWTVNLRVKNYIINWQTKPLHAMGTMARELLLTFATLIIYLPAASLNLYKYFMDRTVADNGISKMKFGFDIDLKNDFLFIWKELLLCIITLGLYYPWAFCKINSRILGKTFTESEEVNTVSEIAE